MSHNQEMVENFRNDLISIKKENIPGIVALGRAIFSRNARLDKLSTLSQPVMFLVGNDDIPRPPKESKEMASRVKASEIHIIKNAGHISNLEQPKSINALLNNFLTKNLKIFSDPDHKYTKSLN